jgi:hypothetical protein
MNSGRSEFWTADAPDWPFANLCRNLPALHGHIGGNAKMAWSVTDVTVSLVSPIQATVQFSDIGSSGLSVADIKVTFPLAPAPASITKQDMISQAQKFLIGAGS